MIGLFQGNVCAPKRWSIISSIVFLTLRTQGFDIHLENSFMEEIAPLVGFIHGDSCDMIQSYDDIESTH